MKLIHFTDTHLVRAGERLYGLDPQARLDACIADINREHPDADLAVITGDLTHFGDAAAYEALRRSLGNLTVPVRLLMGNHDSRDRLRAAFPNLPLDRNGHAQSVLDTDAGRLLFLDTTQEGTHAGWYDDDRMGWLEEQLAEAAGRPAYLFMHHPPFRLGIPAMDRIGIVQAEAFNRRITPHLSGIRHLFFGHVHRPISGSWRGVPFSTLRGTNHQVWLDFKTVEDIAGSHEPPAYAVVLIDAETVVVHQHDYLDDSRKFMLSDIDAAFWSTAADRQTQTATD